MTVILACKCQCIINFHSSLLVSQTSVNHCNYHINQKSQHKLPLLPCCIILKFNIWWKLWFVFLEYLTAACYEQGFFWKAFPLNPARCSECPATAGNPCPALLLLLHLDFNGILQTGLHPVLHNWPKKGDAKREKYAQREEVIWWKLREK